ncbi:dTDP-6-deoxy-3,4-keto-hexulose isomerase [Campylobacter avium LMG 24591]|uniref:dTDP-6-deoxy-3,4-keto-hexulose isomerase n=1 Tax=Campylobacter avium LMG 24591 TaxID=522484 RepID=A0A222MY80_9BACT|nr:FdtA/QdtA family cupin domain-containing protein [Campylobacter avium]ASQ30947.1 dTDP-6-deoxy-3,4-keto-hexulose isomerase [Campylobacter avium LMG 24591]OYD78759.1 dTDP-6-deoxy-3,4-keto-hexulose isomerase [Campylobacter avium]
MQYKLLKMEINKDKRGSLIALENLKTVPFEIKRVYYIYDTKPDVDRGGHAHTNLEQILIMMDGACEVLLDNGKEKKSIILNRPDVGLYIGKNMWREMKNFSYGAKLLVLASDFYDEKEYIRSYDEFLRAVK